METEKIDGRRRRASEPKARVWRNARLATLLRRLPGMGIVERGAVAAQDGRIAFAGAGSRPARGRRLGAETIDCEGRWITPGLIDCHTHLVHAGNRANEFEMRLAGATYEEVARAGGGIVSSVKALRAASEDELVRAVAAAPRRADCRRRHHDRGQVGLRARPRQRGEVAAGRAAAGRRAPGYGAHQLPRRACAAARSQWRQGRLHRTRSRTRCCRRLPPRGWPMRSTASARASPFRPSRSRGCSRRPGRSACRSSSTPTSCPTCTAPRSPRAIGALSADHLEYTDEAGAAAMAQAGRSRCILPGAFYFIRETKKPPVDLFRGHGVTMAVATDCNPGTSPLTSLLLDHEHGRDPVRHDGRGMPCRRHARRRARARPARRNRHAGSRQMGRPRDLGYRAPGRARLPHGVQPAACPYLEGP